MPAQTGEAVPEFAAFDRAMQQLIRKLGSPGGTLAVAVQGKVVLARGFGVANVDTQAVVKPETPFRIASVSKPITAAAILRLWEMGRLALTDRVVDRLPGFRSDFQNCPDQRWHDVTIRHLLQHTGGWDGTKGFDPMFAVERIAAATGETKRPLPPSAVLRYMIAQPLDFAPGSRFVYSNFGYSMLGRVAESVTGAPYEDAVRSLVLEPLGLSDMRLGQTLPEDRPVEEADYYPKYVKAPSVFESSKPEVPEPDGAFSLETMDAHGGWTATATSLVLFGGLPFLRLGTLRETVRPPDPPATGDKGAYCGLGWFVRPQQDGFNRWHTGSFPGTASLLVHTHDGVAWAAILKLRRRERANYRSTG